LLTSFASVIFRVETASVEGMSFVLMAIGLYSMVAKFAKASPKYKEFSSCRWKTGLFLLTSAISAKAFLAL